jgi:hypothetical protein
MDPMIVEAIKQLLGIVQSLPVLEAVKAKLINRPDPAAEALGVALGEIAKIFGVTQTELERYTALWFDAEGTPRDNRRDIATLASLSTPALSARLHEAKGHCGKITRIYRRYLRGWFSNALNAAEAQRLAALFNQLQESDALMVDAIDKLAKWLPSEAAETLRLVDDEQYAEANQRVKQARRQVMPMLTQMSEAIVDLRRLQTDFITLAGTV